MDEAAFAFQVKVWTSLVEQGEIGFAWRLTGSVPIRDTVTQHPGQSTPNRNRCWMGEAR